MEEFRKFVFGVWDRLRDNSKRKLDLKNMEFELSQRNAQAARDAETHKAELERRRHELRGIAAEADLKQLHSVREMVTILSNSSNPGEFNRLMAILQSGENTLGQLILAGKITNVEETKAKTGR